MGQMYLCGWKVEINREGNIMGGRVYYGGLYVGCR